MLPHQKIRNYVRVPLQRGTLVSWERMGERKVSSLSVLGLGGLFISTSEPPSTGDIITLVFNVPGGEIRARARVCDSQPGKGMGIQFVSMGQEARARLTRHLSALKND